MARICQLDPRDNALVALEDLRAGEAVAWQDASYTLAAAVPAKHKFATAALAAGDPVLLYGVLVGRARHPIARGQLLTTANLEPAAGEFSARRAPVPAWRPPDVAAWRDLHFFGYHRADGRVGTRNHWLVAPLVFCENRNLAELERAFQSELGDTPPSPHRAQVARLAELYRQGRTDFHTADLDPAPTPAPARQPLFPHLDGVRFLAHDAGCGGTREDAESLCGLLAGYLCHPNVAGATILSLGCQQAQVASLRAQIHRRDPAFAKPLVIIGHQAAGTVQAVMDQAVRETFAGLAEADRCRRAPAPLSALTVGLKCGGSDGFSGLSANPALGRVSDLLVALGGRTILAEFPELCGVEQSLVDRCATQQAADRFVALMRAYAARAQAVGSSFEANPSPGNIRDGLLTDAMKSAGAARKGGTAPVAAVLDYPEPATAAGLNLLCTPGNDVECVTAQVAAGASLVLFTTGLGTPTGNPIVPVVKIATNTTLARRMPDIVDFDAGPIITGQTSIERTADAILARTVAIASGAEPAQAELLRQYDFIPWRRGVSL